MKHRLLLITDHFPPENSGGIGRTFSLYKYLPDYDFDVIVLTKDSYGRLISEKNIFRLDSYTNWRQGKLFSFKSFSKIILTFFFRFLFIYTDLWWLFKALKKSDQLITNDKFDFIYVSFPSTDCLILGLKIHKKYGIPIISEFRDGLVFESIINPANFIQKRIIKILEKQVALNSTAIITICKPLSDYFLRTYSTKNLLTVYNGYDTEDFADLNRNSIAYSQKSKTRIAHFGSLNASRKSNRENIFIALAQLKISELISNLSFELAIFGKLTTDEYHLIEQYKLEDIITVCPLLEKKSGFQKIFNEYDYLLVYGVLGQSTVVSSKLLEYLKLEKPILGICKGNEAEKIIHTTKTGEVSDFDSQSIESLFTKAIRNEISYTPDAMEISKYDRKYQAMLISGFLKSLLS